MRVRYDVLITESEDELSRLERKYRGSPCADRIKMLRLLKANTYSSRQQLAPVLGYSERQLQRWWNAYNLGGLDAILEEKQIGGSEERITPEAKAAMRKEITQGNLTSLKNVQHFLKSRFGIEYKSLQGISDLLKRHQIDLKSSIDGSQNSTR